MNAIINTMILQCPECSWQLQKTGETTIACINSGCKNCGIQLINPNTIELVPVTESK